MPGGKHWTKSLYGGAGCAKCGPKCANCWALQVVRRMVHNPVIKQSGSRVVGLPGELVDKDGEWTGRCRWDLDKMKPPLWRTGHVVAVWWLGDLFMDNVPDEIVSAQLHFTATDAAQRSHMGLEPNRYLYLTSRPQNMVRRLKAWIRSNSWPKRTMMNTHWFGSSVSDERSWDAARKAMSTLPVQMHRWVSLEPWLKPISFGLYGPEPFEWVVAGAETGPRARPAQVKWFDWLIEWTRQHRIPLYLKQLDRRGTRELNGVTYDEFPWSEYDEFPWEGKR